MIAFMAGVFIDWVFDAAHGQFPRPADIPGQGIFNGEIVAQGIFVGPADALFYLETSVNDRKLGWALGYNDCGQDDCSDYIESPFAEKSTVWVAQNLTTFRALFMGVEGAGFYDLLTTFDEAALADDMVTALDTVDTAASLLSDALPTTQSENAEDGDALYEAVKQITDLLKGDIATVLTLQIPSEAAGDVD